MKIFLLRHGETVWNQEQRTQGHTDIDLTPRGRAQALALARSLSGMGIVTVYASPLRRAMETARTIAEFHGVRTCIEEGLKELNQGQLEGLTYQELVTNHQEFLKKWMEDPVPLRMPGGESMAELQERVWEVIQRIARVHANENVGVVSHNLAIRAILCKVLGLPLGNFRRLSQEVAARNVIEYGERGWLLASLNDICHLQE